MSDIVHLRDVQPRSRFFTVWERHRHTTAHWFVECFAEFLGVFFYVYAGVGSQTAWINGTILNIAGLGSVLQIGLAYAFGIVFAIGICASTSGGHFNPAVTLTLVVFKKFPPLKALRYIIAQILGGYVACLLIYVQWFDIIKEAEGALVLAKMEAIMFTPQGPAGAFALYALPGLNLGRAFLNEFVTDVFLALVIWGSIDPTNILIPPAVGPFVIAIAYAAAIWGFATPTLAANPARDLGGRLAALTIWGKQAAGGPYAAIAALTSIPATMFGVLLHELFLTDSARVIPAAQREYMSVHMNHAHAPGREDSDISSNEKADIEHLNNA
ncbi:putative aquaporin 2 [Rhodocollybia butyracea]|uniref:Aquaporin 2 n=1 Tax=Rhodocollybia butyracea TaxID=206335 RepID=A0A9P5Q3R2_9AGAR|nr:putative aquaporin 2 [Rhodocollybia butyracea]